MNIYDKHIIVISLARMEEEKLVDAIVDIVDIFSNAKV